MTDPRAFTTNLMGEMVRDLGTKFDWRLRSIIAKPSICMST
jgi:hypothetical protein